MKNNTKYKIIEILSKVFTQEELDAVDPDIRQRLTELELVEDVQEFVENCRNESLNVKKSGEHRYDDWNEGWSGKGIYDEHPEIKNIPYYMKNNTHVRANGNVYRDISGFTELFLLRAIQEIAISKVVQRDCEDAFIEYGCGTGHNIEFLKKRFSNLEYYGADWTQAACDRLFDLDILPKQNIFKVNFFDRNTFQAPAKKYYAFTNHSLEQSGSLYADFMEFLIADTKCLGGIHIEPIRELLDRDDALDREAFDYAERRGYLKDFSLFMKNKPIEILECKNTGIGSKYNNGFQILSWRNSVEQQSD